MDYLSSQRFETARQLPYLSHTLEQLRETKTKVSRWVDWEPDSDYEAFYDSRRVVLPIPTCKWSFLVCLHEIGHISTGERMHSYLAEYNAEQWAINRAWQRYSIRCSEYEQDAKIYVFNHLTENLLFYGLKYYQVKPHVLDWLEITVEELVEKMQQMRDFASCKRLSLR